MIRRIGFLSLAVALLGMSRASYAVINQYGATLTGPNESPTNSSPGTGTAEADYDTVLHTLHVHVDFTGLTGTTTASHIHSATATPGVSTAGVATTTPTFAGFPLGVTAGTYDNILDLTLASSYNPSFVTANGGTPATAEVALISGIVAGEAYLNIHTSTFGGGEIRGFLAPIPEPASLALLGIGGLLACGRRRQQVRTRA